MGTLSGNGRFGPYGMILGAEGVFRILPVIVLYAAGIDNLLWYGLALAVPPLLAALVALRGQHGLLDPGPDAEWSELSTNLTLLFLGSLAAQALSYAAALGVLVLAQGKVERDAAADFIVGFFIARIPILLFQAIQAALLPKLAAPVRRGQARRLPLRPEEAGHDRGRRRACSASSPGPRSARPSARSCSATSSTSAAATSPCSFLGSAAFILALTLAQALIALLGHGRALIAWTVGLVFCVGVMALGSSATVDDLFLRAELGYVVGCATAATMMADLPRGAGAGPRPGQPAASSSRPSSTSRSRSDSLAIMIRLAIDGTPLLGPRTGIGEVVAGLTTGLATHADVDVTAYALTWRGRHDLQAAVPPGIGAATGPDPRARRAAGVAARGAPADRAVDRTGRRGARDQLRRATDPGAVDRLGLRPRVRPVPRARAPPTRSSTRRCSSVPSPEARGSTRRATSSRARSPTGSPCQPERVVRVYPGVPGTQGGDPASGRRLAGADRYVLAMGTIEPRKNLPMLVRAFDAAAEDDPELALVVAGAAGWGVDAFDESLARAHHRGRVRRLGYVSDGQRRDLLAGAAVLAYPSRYEGFGFPPLEAMAAGVPVVAARSRRDSRGRR